MFAIRCFKTGAGRSPFPTRHEMMLVAMIKHATRRKFDVKLEPEYMSLNLAYM